MKILMVTTSASRLSPDQPTGLWLEEFAVPYEHFADGGATMITVASPLGGRVPIDPRTEPSDRQRSKWSRALQALESSVRLDSVDDEAYDGVFIPGGHGPVVDLPYDPALRRLLANFHADGKMIGAVCHGPAALLNVRGPDGHYLIRDMRLTGFSNLEERFSGMHGKVPFLLEDEIKRRGAKYDAALIPMTSHVVRDGSLITGQNPGSSHKIAEAFLEGLQQNIELFEQLGVDMSSSARRAHGESSRSGMWVRSS